MKNVILRALTGMVLLVGCASGHAATMDITASFSPSMEKPENNTFTNTTPQSGYCQIWPSYCNPGDFSINLPLSLTRTKTINANASPRDGIYFKIPSGMRKVTLTNSDGDTFIGSFRMRIFSARYIDSGDNYTWDGGHLAKGMPPCSEAAVPLGVGGKHPWLHFAWNYPTSDAACYRISTVDYTNAFNRIEQLSIAYDLIVPSPLQIDSGIYTGTLALKVGPGGDFDFGDNFQASDTELNINFTLTVNHELKLTTTADNQAVSLLPCASGRICTEDEGAANWERWMVTRITPQLTGRSNFSLSSSGRFTVYLECEQQSGSDCALKSDNTPSQTVPVQTLLTLPDNIVDDSTGSTVSKRRLAVGKDVTKNVFTTKAFGQNRAGSIDFLVGQKDVDTMLKTRPDTYRGAVTVIFDPSIY
ncbi:MAG: hypothetical protein H6R25_3877 [Proteobacteria bacterium]|nr:hypothetical protein [Pseudomonadota bacterium]